MRLTKAQLEAENWLLIFTIIVFFVIGLVCFIALMAEKENEMQITREECAKLLLN